MQCLVLSAVGLVVSGAWAASPERPASTGSLRVMSFNIRNSGANDGDNHWAHRKDLAVETIRAFDPDLLGTQEVLQDQADHLQAALPEYGFIGVGRDDGKRAGEYSPLFYRKARFDLLRSGTFWLSPTPDTPGSKGWDAAIPRIVTWATLRDRATGQSFFYLNTHWDHRGEQARVESARLMRQRISDLCNEEASLGPRPSVIVTGDFNAFETTEAIRTLTAPGANAVPRLIDTYRTVHPTPQPDEASFHDFDGRREGSRIDFILHTPGWTATEAGIDRTQNDGRYPSDHYPVTTVLVRE